MISCQVLTWSKLPPVLLGSPVSSRFPDVNLLCSVSAPITASLDRLVWDPVHTVRCCRVVVTGQCCCQCLMASHWGRFFSPQTEWCCWCYTQFVFLAEDNSIFAQMRNTESCHSPNMLWTFTFRTFLCSLDTDATPDWFTSVENWATKKNCFSTFCAYKAWWRTERRECTKVIMSPPFSDEKLIWNCPDFSYKGRRHQGCMFTLSPQNVLSQPQNYSRRGKKKWFRCSRCCVHPLPPISYWIAFSCLLEGFGEEHYKRNSYTDVCLVFMQQSAESGCRLWWVFIRKSYLKWNLSWAACGKHCHVRETAKPYKAFPPKGST